MRVLFAILLLPLLGAAQDEKPAEEPKKEKTAAEIEIPDPGIGIEDSAVARREVARFETEMRAAKEPAQEVSLGEYFVEGGGSLSIVRSAATLYLETDWTAAEAEAELVADGGGAWLGGHAFLVDDVEDVVAVELLHDQIQVLRFLARVVVDLDDIGMFQRRDGPRLAIETLACLGVTRQLGGDHLDGDLAVKLRIPREVDASHGAFA